MRVISVYIGVLKWCRGEERCQECGGGDIPLEVVDVFDEGTLKSYRNV